MKHRCEECGDGSRRLLAHQTPPDADLDYIYINVQVPSGDGDMLNFGNICRDCLNSVLAGVEIASVDNGGVRW